MSTIPVNPKVLEWARNQRYLTLEDAALRLDISPDELKGYEKGVTSPNLTFLRNMAFSYELPLATLMMPDILPKEQQLKDFRTFGGRKAEMNFDLATTIDEVKYHLEGVADIIKEDPSLYTPVKFQRLLFKQSEVANFASLERLHLGVTIQQQMRWSSNLQAFRQWRYRVEGTGVFVYLMKFSEANRIRGFSMFHQDRIPVIVVNDREETYQAKIFTLIHEYAHLLLRDAGICDQNPHNRIERFCNLFAANVLMPIEILTTVLDIPEWKPREWEDKEISHGTSLIHVSRDALVLRLEELGLAPEGFYNQKKKEWDEGEPKKKKSGFGRSTKAEQCVRKLGGGYTSLIVKALDRAAINRVDAVQLLHLKPKHFSQVRGLLAERI